ncbi:hypothetical protein [Streptomyces sporangiiformans]|uniref:Uncharacterized protein n=1 Tax=Streptomyces sporangiiformans TaxID=2315329 RepID=A0A505CY27_9ACTN|nr:hypothetical protein [Streptomyces sporangiiformans]TPQ16474.1 hypothetical protein FGD71_041670 [Streptomyces sporangiiformans]
MGIESDKLVFDYLSQVGDLAQSRQLPSATRMRLVTELRGEIDRRRAKATVDSPASVRRILARLGSPEDVVSAAHTDADGGTGETSAAAVPSQRMKEPEEPPKRLRRVVPRPRPAEPETSDVPPFPDDAPSPPHLAGIDELGSGRPDWWRVDSGPFGPSDSSPLGTTDSVPGFVGGVEIPELLKPPPGDKHEPGPAKPTPLAKAEPEELVEEPADGAGAAASGTTKKKPRRLVPAIRPRPRAGGGRPNPLLLLAAALLVAGAFIGNVVPMGLGWLIAYLSRRLTPAESKWAVLVVPGLVAAAGITWLWGRTEGRWGEPIAQGHMSDAIAETWPWVLKGAAVASALYLVWRSQRGRS